MSVFEQIGEKPHIELANVKIGECFIYGGIEWVKLDQNRNEVIAIATEPVFERAFDEEKCNDWRKSSLRRELNGQFLDALIAEGANPTAFVEFESNLTADDGMTDYGTAQDKIALITCDLYRKYRTLLPKIGRWWWTLTPLTCDPGYLCNVRIVNSSGAISWNYTNSGDGGVRPLCHLESSIFVDVPDEDGEKGEQLDREKAIDETRDAVLEVLDGCAESLFGDVIGAVVKALSERKLQEETPMTKDCKFSSLWDDGIEIITNCRVNTSTKEVFDIDVVDTHGLEMPCGEYVIIDGKGFPVSRRGEGCTEYWYK